MRKIINEKYKCKAKSISFRDIDLEIAESIKYSCNLNSISNTVRFALRVTYEMIKTNEQQKPNQRTVKVKPSYDKYDMYYGFCECGEFVCQDDPICPKCFSKLEWLI